MGIMKQSRKKKDSVAPISDSEDTSSALHPGRSRQGSRGVSFSTSRGKIWLILIANLAIVTSFIFMSSSRFPSLYGEGIVNNALEQDRQHRGSEIENTEQTFLLVVEDTAVTKEPRVHVQDSTRSGGYTKLTRTDQPEAADKDSGSETQAPLARETRVEEAPKGPVTVDQAEETQSVAEQTTTPTSGDSSSKHISSVPSDGQNSHVGSSGQEFHSGTLPPLLEPSNEIDHSSTPLTSRPQSEDTGPSAIESEGKHPDEKPLAEATEQKSTATASATQSDDQKPTAKSSDQESQSETLPPPPEPSHETEYSSITPTSRPQTEDTGPSAIESEGKHPAEKPLAEATEPTSTAAGLSAIQSDHGSNGPAQETPAVAVENASPTPKFDPRVNIFEWKPPISADAAKATQWTKTVKDKVNYIRNFQLGGDVLRALIREHKDDLIALREELFG